MANKTTLENPTGIPELDAVMASLTKDWGEDMSGDDYGDLKFFPSGSLSLDIGLGRGGWPFARMIEIFGTSRTLKTSISLALLKSLQDWRREQGIIDKRDLILDIECGLERSFIEGFGIDMSQVIWKRFDSVEKALQFGIDLVKTTKIGMVIFDSIDAAQNEQMLRRQIGEKDVGGISKDMNNACRQLSKLVAKTGTIWIWINQIKMNPGAMFGSPEVTPGGAGPLYYSRLRIKMLTPEKIPDAPNTCLLKLSIAKTSLGAPVLEHILVPFEYGKGFNQLYDIENTAKKQGILAHSAGQTKVQWTQDSEPVPLLPDIDKGKAAGQEALRQHPELLERLRHASMRAAGIPGAKPDSEFNQ